MSEFDDLINDAIGDFRSTEATTPAITPGTAAVRATVRHRRTVRLTTLSVLGAVLIAAPIAAFAADPHGNNPPPVPGNSITPTPVESATPLPASPSAEPPPDGVITAAQLGAVTVDFPPFLSRQCDTTAVKLAISAGKGEIGQSTAWIEKVVHTDLDGDSALETAALVQCRSGETPRGQVLAFDRNADGAVVLLGVVVAEDSRYVVRDIAVRDGGGIVAEVSDFIACCGTEPGAERHQFREYGWEGGKFRQLAGPTAFGDPARVTDLQVTVTDVVLGPVVDGKRTGTAKVTVKNNGPHPSGRFRVGLGNCSFACAGPNPAFASSWVFGTYQAPHAPLPAGEQVSETVAITVDASFTEGSVEAAVSAVGMNDLKGIDDTKPENNAVIFKIRAS